MTSITGVGVYNCHCQHDNRIALFSSSDCECMKKHVHSAECNHQEGSACCIMANEDEQTTDGHCCQVVYKVLKIDHEIVSSKISFNGYSTFITLLFTILPVAVTTPECYSFWERCQVPLFFHAGKSSLIYQHAQLRL